MRQLYAGYRRLCELNVAISKESGLKPILLHVNKILTPKYFMKNAIVLKHMPASKQLGGRVNDKYLCLLLEKKDSINEGLGSLITYEEDSNFESRRAALAGASQNMGSRRGNLKSEGVERGYYFKYLEISVKDVVVHYRNEVKLEKKGAQEQDSKSLFLHGNSLTPPQLREIVDKYDHIVSQVGLDEIKPKRGKEIRALTDKRR